MDAKILSDSSFELIVQTRRKRKTITRCNVLTHKVGHSGMWQVGAKFPNPVLGAHANSVQSLYFDLTLIRCHNPPTRPAEGCALRRVQLPNGDTHNLPQANPPGRAARTEIAPRPTAQPEA